MQGPARAGMFAALHYRNYRLWFVGQSVSLVGMWMSSQAQGWVVYQLSASEFALGAIQFAMSMPSLFLMLFAGVVADRVSRRGLMLRTQSVMMCVAFGLAVLAGTGVLQIWHVAVAAFIGGTAQAFDAPARQALTVDMVEDRRDLSNAIALNSMMFNLARVLGPGLGAAVLAAVGAAWCFGLNSLSYIGVLAALFLMRVPPAAVRTREPGAVLSQIAEGMRYVWDNVNVRTMVVLAASTSMFGMSYAVLLPAFAKDVLNVGAVGLGLLNVGMGIGALTGSLIAAYITRYPRKGLVATMGNLLFPFALLVFGLSTWLPLSMAALAVFGLAWVGQSTMINTMIQHMVPDVLRGRVMSVYMLMFFGTTPFAALMTGAVAEQMGPGLAVALNALIALSVGIFVLLRVPSFRRLEG